MGTQVGAASLDGWRSRLSRLQGRRARSGALQSIELLLILPIVTLIFFGLIEFSLLWSANMSVKLASQIACRAGTLPAHDPAALRRAVQAAAARALHKPRLVRAHRLSLQPGLHTGDVVVVEIRVPMRAVAPDLLRVFGLGLRDRELVGYTVMRKE